MPWIEIKRHKPEGRRAIRVYNVGKRRPAYILVPYYWEEYFPDKVRVLFDPEHDLLALKPSTDPYDYKLIEGRRIACSSLLFRFNLLSQTIDVSWDNKRKILIGKVRRENGDHNPLKSY